MLTFVAVDAVSDPLCDDFLFTFKYWTTRMLCQTGIGCISNGVDVTEEDCISGNGSNMHTGILKIRMAATFRDGAMFIKIERNKSTSNKSRSTFVSI